MGDADLTLRHVAHRHPDGLLAPLRPLNGAQIVGWEDTQLTAVAVERRPDKVLAVRVKGELRALVVEFEYELRRTVGKRVHRIEAMLSDDGALGPRFSEAPPITTLVIVLSGRKRGWPKQMAHRTGWPELGFSGAHFRVDAVYQRTVEELRARGSVLWLVFTPLARDATLDAIRSVVSELRRRVRDPKELREMYVAMMVLADIDPWNYHLNKEIAAMIEDETEEWPSMKKTLKRAFDKGKREGQEEGEKRGEKRGEKKGIVKMLRRIFMRRVGRPLDDAEKKALAARIKAGDPEVEDRALTLEGEKLAAWLLDPNAS